MKNVQPDGIYVVDLNLPNRKKLLEQWYNQIKSEHLWKDLELWAGVLLSELSEMEQPYFIHDSSRYGSQVDAIVHVKRDEIIIIEAKEWRSKVQSKIINEFSSKMDTFNSKLGFIVTTNEITKDNGALDTIKRLSAQNKFIVPLEDRAIRKFFESKLSIREFLNKIILIAKLYPEKLTSNFIEDV